MQTSVPTTARLREGSTQPPADGLTIEDYRRLSWFKATYVASVHLQRAGLDHDRIASRHLAYGLWLKATGRLDGEFTIAASAQPAARAAYTLAERWHEPWPPHDNQGGKAT